MALPTKYNYASAKSHKFTLANVRAVIDRYLAEANSDLYPKIERLLSEPGNTGRVSWDQCMAVQLILERDANEEIGGTGELNAMLNNSALTMPAIGTELFKVLRSANFIIERGRITGVVETSE